jgi:CrcB protein
MKVLWVFLGSGAGGVLRYLMVSASVELAGPGFPYGTIAVNTLGSFAISLVMTLAGEAGIIGPDLRVALVTGVLGGFTTYSAFNFETLALAESGRPGAAALNVVATLGMCIGAGVLGLFAARRFVG